MARRPVDPEEELRWMSQEVRGYVEAVLNSLAANVPKVVPLSLMISLKFTSFCSNLACLLRHLVRFLQAVVLCQVEKAKEDMLNQLYSSIRFAFIFQC